jgi:hypothetical protein
MTVEVSERSFERTIECALLRFGPDACEKEPGGIREEPAPYGEFPAGGFRKRPPEEYDAALCLLPRDVIDFVWRRSPRSGRSSRSTIGPRSRSNFSGGSLARSSGAARSTSSGTASRIRAASSGWLISGRQAA